MLELCGRVRKSLILAPLERGIILVHDNSSVIEAEDYFTSLEMVLTEPIAGEQFDVLPEDETLSWDEEWAHLNRRDRRMWGKPSGKPRYKK